MRQPAQVSRIFPTLGVWGLCALALSQVACTTQGMVKAAEEPNYEGLVNVRARRVDIAQVRPGTVFSRYTGIVLESPELAFRVPDRAELQFPLTEDQKQRFHDMLSAAFDAEFTELRNIELVDQTGEGVLELSVRVENITATVPPRGTGGGLHGFALVAVGDATLVLELRDSRTQELLARAIDIKALEGAATFRDEEMLTRWSDVERLCARWASVARTGLEALIEDR